jgi:hypothetical protein
VAAEDSPFGRLREIGIGEHHKGVRAAELHRRLLQRLAGLRSNGGTCILRAGERHPMYARIIDDHLGLRAGGIEIREGAIGQARLLHQLVEGCGALRYVGSMLQKQGVAGGQLRREDAGDLIIGEIPRLDGEQDAERLIGEHRLALGWIENRQLLGLEQLLGIAHVVFQDLRGELDLGLRLGEELAHFERQKSGVVVAVAPQDVGGVLQDSTALGKGSLLPSQKGNMSLVEGFAHFRIRSVWIGLERFPRIGIDRLVGHFVSPFAWKGRPGSGGKVFHGQVFHGLDHLGWAWAPRSVARISQRRHLRCFMSR